MAPPKGRAYCFTWNNYTQESEGILKDIHDAGQSRYVVYGKEVGENGTPHLQGYIYFVNPKTFSAVCKVLKGAHISASKGSPSENYSYCTKDKEFVEYGTIPQDPSVAGSREKERWERIRALAKEGNLDDVDADVYIRHYSTLKRIAKDHMQDVPDLDGVCGEWYYGDPGTGKSMTARKNYPGAYLKMANKWWDGYNGEEYVIMDEVELHHKVLGHHLKIWTDRYAFIAEIKGCAQKIRPKKFIVTANYSIEEIFHEDEQLVKALKRRFRITKFSRHAFNINGEE